jgi:hypothetical protein
MALARPGLARRHGKKRRRMNTIKTIGLIIAVIGLCFAISAFMDWIDPHYRHTVVARGLILAPILLVSAIIKDLFG